MLASSLLKRGLRQRPYLPDIWPLPYHVCRFDSHSLCNLNDSLTNGTVASILNHKVARSQVSEVVKHPVSRAWIDPEDGGSYNIDIRMKHPLEVCKKVDHMMMRKGKSESEIGGRNSRVFCLRCTCAYERCTGETAFLFLKDAA